MIIRTSYFKFIFVREPLERLLSAYNSKFVNKQWPRKLIESYKTKILERYKQDEPSSSSSDQDLTFRKFIYYVSDFGFDRNPHWRSYGPPCHPCDIEYDFIGHFEDMSEEAPYILRQTGMDRAVLRFIPTILQVNFLKAMPRYPRRRSLSWVRPFKKTLKCLITISQSLYPISCTIKKPVSIENTYLRGK